MSRTILLISLILSFSARSQKLLKGVVMDAEKNKPLAFASIFLSNTSIGTKSNEQGNFELNIPNGRFNLVVSCIGYDTYNQTITAKEREDFMTIKLRVKPTEMETIVIEPYEKDGWEHWGRFFTENFIGNSAAAENCIIRNTGIIRFRNSKKTNQLTAYAPEPLVIENKDLGYRIIYQLETFSFDFKTHYLVYTGYPFFELMKGNNRKQRNWEKHRKEAYYGSLMHFMRSIFRNTLLQEGFEVRALRKVPNTEKQRVKEIYANRRKSATAGGTLVVTGPEKDSSEYYEKILAQKDEHDIIGKNILTGDSIAYAVNATTAGLSFDNYLLVIYKNKLAPPEYIRQFPKSSSAMMSQIVLFNGTSLEIEANGNYYDPIDLVSLGYWSWSEKIANMLPLDYKVSN